VTGKRNSPTNSVNGQQLSRSVEDCGGCPALAGVRHLGLDDPNPGCPVLHFNFGAASGHVERLHLIGMLCEDVVEGDGL